MIPILWRASLRHLVRHPWQTGLAILGIALGVAVVVAIDTASSSALRGYALSQEVVTGRATHQIVGGSRGLDAALYRRLRAELPGVMAAPVVDGGVVVAADDRPATTARGLRLLGVDPVAETGLRPLFAAGERDSSNCPPRGVRLDLTAVLDGETPLALGEEQAAELGVALGAPLLVRAGGEVHRGRVAAILAPRERVEALGLMGLIVTDVASAQRLLGLEGRLQRIDLVLRTDAEVAAVGELLPPEAQLLASDRKTNASREMTRAFRLNLTALGLLALVCGLFLIYNTVRFSVVQRRALLGRLRAVGVTRRQILALVLGETAVTGLVGTLLGVVLGLGLSSGLVRLVTRTVDDLYFSVQVRAVTPQLSDLLLAASLGILGSLAAALLPALEASRSPVSSVLRRSSLEASLRHSLGARSLAGVALAAAGTAALMLSQGLVPTFAGLFVAILGITLLVPAATLAMAAGLARPSGRIFGAVGRLAVRGVAGSLSRTAVAIAALTVALAVTVGVGLMIRSFRDTVDRWLQSTLSADLYVRPAGSGAGRGATLEDGVVDDLRRVDGVERVNTVRHLFLDGVERIHVVALDTDRRGFSGFRIDGARAQDVWPDFDDGRGVLVSEPYAFRHRLESGDRIELHTDRGPRRLAVLGVYADYASDRGIVLLSRGLFERLWQDREVSGVSLVAVSGVDPATLADRVRARLGDRDDLTVESSRALREASLAVFDRTFAVTGVLRLLVVLVAFVGVVSALMALQLERRRELGTLRANGLTPGQLRVLVAAQTGLLGLVSGLLAAPLGLGLAAAMVYVINRRSFGWSMDLSVSSGLLVQAVLLAVAAALLAGLYPGARMARTSPAEALRDE